MATRTKDPETDDEVAAARAKRNGSGNGRPTPEELAGGGPADPDGGGQSLEDMEANGTAQTTTEDDGQVAFVWEHGRKVPLTGIVKRGTPVEYRVRFGGLSVKGKGTPVPLDAKDLLLVGRYFSGGLNFVPTHDDEGNVEKVTVFATLKPQGPPVDVGSPEGALVLGPPSLEAAVRSMLDDDVPGDEVRAEVEKVLAER